jgi:nicotinamide-nucleotide adenylyltransferase
MKKYQLGMFLGRFQPFHNGHKAILDEMLNQCEQVLIVVGSAQERGTVKNPFPAWERCQMISEVYNKEEYDNRINIISIPDRLTVGNDSGWGDYVMDYLANYNYFPDAIFQGREAERDTWFGNWTAEIVNISRLEVPISATLIRAAIVERNMDFICKWCPLEVADHIEKSIYWGRDFHE